MNLIEVNPDDVLVLRTPDCLSKHQHDGAVEVLRGILGQKQRILILDGGQALDVIRVSLYGKVETNDIVRVSVGAGGGSVDGYQGATGSGPTREVQHVDTPDEEPAGIPPHVWLYRNMLTDMQRLAPLGIDETNGQYAVAIDQLTDEQRAIPHVAKQLDEHKGAG